MERTIAKLNEALIAITADQQGMTGDDLLTSLKAVKSVVRAIELVSKVSKVDEPTPPPEKEPEPEETSEVETQETEENSEVEAEVVEPEVVEAEVVEAKVELEDKEEVMEFKPNVPVGVKNDNLTVKGDGWQRTMTIEQLGRLEWSKTVDHDCIGDTCEEWETEIDGHSFAIQREAFVDDPKGWKPDEWAAFIDHKEAFVSRDSYRFVAKVAKNGRGEDSQNWNMRVMSLACELGLHKYTDEEAERFLFMDVEDKTRIVVPYYVKKEHYDPERRTGVIRVEDLKKADWVPTAVDDTNGSMGLGAEFTLANGHKIELVVWHSKCRPNIMVMDNGKSVDGRCALCVAKHNGKTCLGIGTGSKCIAIANMHQWCFWDQAAESAALFEQVFVK